MNIFNDPGLPTSTERDRNCESLRNLVSPLLILSALAALHRRRVPRDIRVP